MKRVWIGALGALLLLAAPLRADIIITTSGGRLVGKIIEEKENEVRIRTERGPIVTVSREEIDSITREKPEDAYTRRLKGLKPDDTKGLLDLAQWAHDQKLAKETQDAYERVLRFDPENVDAHLGLGYEKIAGKWLKGDELTKAKGLVEYQGRLVTPEERSLLEQGYVKRNDHWVSKEEAEAIDEGRPYRPGGGGGDSTPQPKADPVEKPEKPAKQPPAPKNEPKPDAPKPAEPAAKNEPKPDLPTDDKELMKIVLNSSKKPEERTDAVKALATKGDTQKLALKQELTKLTDDTKKGVLDYFKSNKGAIRTRLAAAVADRRKAALTFIFDKTKYPDEDHGKVGQPEVDRLVGELRRAWQDPLRELMLDKSEKKLMDKLDELKRVAGWLKDPVGVAYDMTKTEEDLAVEANKAVAMWDVGIDNQDQQILDASRAILKRNQTCQTTLTAEERDCIVATNEYRMMFGLLALKVHEGLVQAARKHSKEMVEKNYFDHGSPVPENSSPAKRCAREGAKYTGENIAMGSASGRTAFHQWYTSSGHHRNMLMRHRSMGVGSSGQYWTEDFGADDPQ